MSDHFPTHAEQAAFYMQWHAQQLLTAGSDILQPLPVYLLGEMAAEVGDEPARCDLNT